MKSSIFVEVADLRSTERSLPIRRKKNGLSGIYELSKHIQPPQRIIPFIALYLK